MDQTKVLDLLYFESEVYTMQMRPSRVLALLRAGKTAFSVKLNTADPRVAEIAAMMDIPCIWVDNEHVANDFRVLEQQIYAAKAYDTDVIVRVPRGSYSDYIRPLELDATGLMVPHVMSVEDAKNVVHMTRFHPIGRRPVDGGNADAKYCMIPQAEYNEQANRERFIILQIEDPEAMDNIDEIAAVEGYDMLFYGPGDYSHSIGHSGEMNHPDVVAGFKKVADAARRHGKFAGTVGSPATARQRMEEGYQYLNLGADVVALCNYFKPIAAFIKEIEKEQA